jgi:tetratricopeptide (TPR) repeat protein
LDEAWRLNLEAEKWLRGGAGERAVWRQRAAIASLRGAAADAARFTALAQIGPDRAEADRSEAIYAAWRTGRLREAIKLIRAALDESPDRAFLWYALADAHMQLDELDLAYGYLDASRAVFPEFYRTYYQRGIIELRRKQFSAARADFDTALALSPRFFPALMQRAVARARLRDLGGAMSDLDAANQISSALLGRPPAQIEFMRARLLSETGDRTGAHRAREVGMGRPPIDAEDWVVRGLARIDDDPKSALTDFEEALKLDPRNLAAMRNKANVLAESLGRPADAITVLDRLIEMMPDSASDRAGRGVVLARLGKRVEAHRDAVAALAADPRPFIRYQVAGIYALTAKSTPADAVESIRLLASAFADGVGLDLVERDTDLDPIRQGSDFRRIVDAARSLRDTSTRKTP